MTRNFLALMCLGAVALAGCSVGNGNKPEALRFVKSLSDLTTLPSKTIFQCFTEGVVLIADFTNGTPGDFTSRNVKYTSSNPGIVQISNGDIPVPGNPAFVFSRGVLIPLAPSAAPVTITAEFAGLKASMEVVVKAPDSIKVTNEQMTDSDGVTRHSVAAMVPGSNQLLSATAVLNDGTTTSTVSKTTAGDWTLTDAPSTEATIGLANGVLVAVGATAATRHAQVTFPACASSLPATVVAGDLVTTFDIKDPVGNLKIVTEPLYPSNNGSMVAGSRQFLRVLADFDADPNNGHEGQDLTFKGISFTFSPAGQTALAYSSSAGLLQANLLDTGITSNGPAAITANFGKAANGTDPRFVSDPLNMTSIAATLDSISVTPAAASIAPLATQQYSAVGTFSPAPADGSHFSWPVQHDVVWSSDIPSVAVISNFTVNSGQAFSIVSAPAADSDPVAISATSNGLMTPTTPPLLPGTATLKVCQTGNSC